MQTFGGSSSDYGSNIYVDNSGNIYSAGIYLSNSVNFGTSTVTGDSSYDFYILKLDSVGNPLWANGYSSTYYDMINSIKVDELGNIYTTGFFSNTLDFDCGTGVTELTSNGLYDIFVQKMDNDGNFIWVNQMGGTGYDSGYALTLDDDANIYVSGIYRSTVDFDPGVGILEFTSDGIYDIYVQKLDNNGNMLWTREFGGTGNEWVGAASLELDTLGYIYCTGTFEETVDFDTDTSEFNLTSMGDKDIFIHKLDIEGNFIWAKQLGGIGEDSGADLVIDINNSIYVTGYFSNIADVNPDTSTYEITSLGGTDAFYVKLSQCYISHGNLIEELCDSYTVPSGNQTIL